MSIGRVSRAALVQSRRAASAVLREVETEVDVVRARRGRRADLALFHQFVPPPTGGGHQFLRALMGELERRGMTVELNRISRGTPVCLFNSFNFDFRRLRRFAQDGCRMVHRIDGPISSYRGFDDGTDAHIAEVNGELADATVVQSRYSLDAHRALGIELADPVLIPNAVDPAIFHPPAEREPLAGRRARIVSTSWSDNPNKGADVFAWLDANLDWDRYELTFVGRLSQGFQHIRGVPPIPSEGVADELRRHDVFLAPSVNDPASNALLEALACGLPAAYRRSGGHPELVGDGGLPFDTPEGVPDTLDALVLELDARRNAIRAPLLSEIADRYLEVLRA